MAFRIRKPSQESFFALNAIPLYSYAIPLPWWGRVGVGIAGRSQIKGLFFKWIQRRDPLPLNPPDRGEGIRCVVLN